jgi:enoyl-CoA hydratase/carnithine racemase
MEKQLIEEISDGVATLRFNRPDRLDALTDYGRLARSGAVRNAVGIWWRDLR